MAVDAEVARGIDVGFVGQKLAAVVELPGVLVVDRQVDLRAGRRIPPRLHFLDVVDELLAHALALELYRQAGQSGLLVFNALGPGMDLPYAQNAVGATQPGSFDDQTQQQFSQYLQQVTQGNTARSLVFYCMNTHCWMSYNAALRAIHLGFRQVYWYRGGIETWQRMQQLSAAMTPPQNPAAQGPAANRPGY